VLPGPEEASLLLDPKFSAIWQKHTANSNLIKMPLLFRYFWSFSIGFKVQQVPNF
jgi:hypothetical protein